MKKILILFVIGIGFVLAGCDKVEDMPPKTDDITKDYQDIKPALLKAEERAVYEARKAEYNAAIKGK